MKTKLTICLLLLAFAVSAQKVDSSKVKGDTVTISKVIQLDDYYKARINACQQSIKEIDMEAELRKKSLSAQIEELIGAIYHQERVDQADIVKGKLYQDKIELRLKRSTIKK